jgi:hypothetical protein
VSRPQDWSPLASSDPVPGDPAEVAALGYRLRNTANGISEETQFLRSLCTDEYWDSDAGTAFRARVESTAGKLHRAHARYAAAAEALGTTVTGAGYAAALNQAQDLSARALSYAQDAWSGMRSQLAIIAAAAPSSDPYGDGYPATAGPRLGSAGNPVLMMYSGSDKPEVATAKRNYNGWADELQAAVQWLGQAVQDRDDAASAASSRILAAIAADGLQDPTGLSAFLDDVGGLLDDTGRYIDHNWAAWVSDLANLCGWISTVLGFLAMVFAFIPMLQPLAAALESAALTFMELSTICSLILEFTGHDETEALVFDAIGLVTFGLGGSMLRGAAGTADAAEALSRTGWEAAADSMEEMLGRVSDEGVQALSDAPKLTARAAETAIKEESGRAIGDIPGLFRGLVSGETWQPLLHPIENIKDAWMEWHLADFDTAFKNGALRMAIGNALHFSSAEIAEQAEKVNDVPELGTITKVTGFNFAATVVRYGHMYIPVQAVAGGSDVYSETTATIGWVGNEIKELSGHG